MKLNLLFTVKNIVLLLLALFYLLIFSHNLLGNIFEGYETSDPITSKDDAVTVQNKLDFQNSTAQMGEPQNGGTSADPSQVPPASTGDMPQFPASAGGDPSQVPASAGDGSQLAQGFQDNKDDKTK